MSNHSTEPWTAHDEMSNEHKGKGWVVRDGDGKALNGWGSITTTEANARMWAASPDVLRLARDLLARLSYDYGDGEDCPSEVEELFERGEKLLPINQIV